MRAGLALLVLLSACDAGEKPRPPPPAPKPAPPPPKPVEPEVRAPVAADLAEYTRDLAGRDKLIATIDTTQGTLTCELFGNRAPMTVANFIGLATGKKPWRDPDTGKVMTNRPFYDGLTFHRVIAEFMIQGGDPLGVGRGGPGYTFNDEIWDGVEMKPGSLAMANAGTRGGDGTNGSQFFIMETGNRPDLAPRHTVFGHCNELDVVKRIARVKANQSDKPVQDVTILHVKISGA